MGTGSVRGTCPLSATSPWNKLCRTSLATPPQIQRPPLNNLASPSKTKTTASPQTPKPCHPDPVLHKPRDDVAFCSSQSCTHGGLLFTLFQEQGCCVQIDKEDLIGNRTDAW